MNKINDIIVVVFCETVKGLKYEGAMIFKEFYERYGDFEYWSIQYKKENHLKVILRPNKR